MSNDFYAEERQYQAFMEMQYAEWEAEQERQLRVRFEEECDDLGVEATEELFATFCEDEVARQEADVESRIDAGEWGLARL